jgi:phage terminase small subunit
LTPLEYMLAVMNDPKADRTRRDRMATAAAPYVHGRPTDVQPGKKETRQIEAQTAHQDSDWSGLVN